MEERRKLKRFTLKLPAKVESESESPHEQRTVHELETEDICSGGAFFRTLQPLMMGTRVRIEIALNGLERRAHERAGALVKLKGYVLRSEPHGMAICFERPFTILPKPA